MRLKRIQLQNFCQFTAKTVEFQDGLNLVIGPNGAGKSNILKGAFAAITGDFGRNDGKQADNICDTSRDTEHSRVSLDFSHGGHEISVVRNLRPVGRELVVNGGKAITADKEVTSRLYGLLGVTDEIIDEYIFVDQWEVFSVFSLSPQKRADAFQRLFRIDKIKKVWDELGKSITQTTAKIPTVQADKDELGRHRDTATDRIFCIDKELSTIPVIGISEQEALASRRIVEDAEKRDYLLRDTQSLQGMLIQYEKEIRSINHTIAELDIDLGTLRSSEPASKVSAERARGVVARWQEYSRTERARENLRVMSHSLDQEFREKGHEPVRPDDFIVDVAQEQRSLDEMNSIITHESKVLAKIRSVQGMNECPTCGHRLDSVSTLREQAEREIARVKPIYDLLRQRISRTESYRLQKSAYDIWRSNYDKRRSDNLHQQKLLDGEESSDNLAGQVEQAKLAIAECDQILEAIRSLEESRNTSEVAKTRSTERFNSARNDLVKAQDALGRLVPECHSSQAVDQAKITIANFTQSSANQRRRSELEGLRLSIERDIQRIDSEIEKLYKVQLESARQISLVGHLNDMREVVHFSNLPRLVSLHYLSRLTDDVNQYLKMFDSPFRVEVDDTLGFTAIFHNGKKRPAGRLSGGQKVVLALAFRLSVNSAFASELGLLCLDEPTVGLDEHNLGCLETALGRLRELSRSTGLQVIMVTHEKALSPLFDNVVSLYSPA